MRRFLSMVLLGATAFLANGCDLSGCDDCGGPPSLGEQLRGTTWQIVSFGDQTNSAREAKSTILLRPDTTTFRGKAACNSYVGDYHLGQEQNNISFAVGVITEVGCELNDYEYELIGAIEETGSYRIEGDHLFLFGEDGDQILEFAAKQASD